MQQDVAQSTRLIIPIILDFSGGRSVALSKHLRKCSCHIFTFKGLSFLPLSPSDTILWLGEDKWGEDTI